jgi:hypothetical protein
MAGVWCHGSVSLLSGYICEIGASVENFQI